MGFFRSVVAMSVDHPKKVIACYIVVTILFAIQFPKINIDTDPENMLPADEPARVAHREAKEEFLLHDAIVVGVVDESSEEGVFSSATLVNIGKVTEEILKIDGVVAGDVMSPSTTDDIQAEGALLRIEPLLDISRTVDEGYARSVRDAALNNPLLKDLLISGDGKAVAIYVPIREKSESYRISQEIKKIIGDYGGDEEYHITGLPVAEDTFGVEMFKQMAISAPMAGLIIFLLMLYFFRRVTLVISSMAVAMISIIWAMGLLIGMGYTVHIMSSMIPIFLMPIAVVDSVHILSEYHDRYGKGGDRKEVILEVMGGLFIPMLYTSLTSAVGFAALSLTPIPPVRVFGLFVAFGIFAAWLLTITFIPAYIMLVPGGRPRHRDLPQKKGDPPLSRIQRGLGHYSIRHNKLVMLSIAVVLVVSIYGISRMRVNDNPVKWFHEGHPIRVADAVLNKHFGGTYMAYLLLEGDSEGVMKTPEVLKAVESIQEYLGSVDVVGKTTSIADVVKKISYELHDEDPAYNIVPENGNAIAQYLFLYEMSGDPDDLLHLITPDARKTNLWVQLKSGDNADMRTVELLVDDYLEEHELPEGISASWAGMPYLNVVWQEKMVAGMLKSLMGGFATVLILMIILFRSFLWGIMAMIPLSVTVAFIYGFVGFAGKDYDMPIAVLSALTLGLSVDFAIHLCQRTRQIFSEEREWGRTVDKLFMEPVRAIIRNAVVIAIGFIPLIIAPLVPYQTVGFFLVAIMTISGITTLVVLPALMSIFKRPLKIG